MLVNLSQRTGGAISLFLGAVIIISAFYMPSPMPVGVFWTSLVVAIPSLIVGSYSQFKMLWFSLGTLIGCVIIVVLNFDKWQNMAVVLTALQIIPTFAAIVSFLFGWVLLSSIRARKEGLKKNHGNIS